MNARYDIAIIGSGPAGLSAAINGKIRNKNIIVFGQKHLSNKIVKAPMVYNYLGLPELKGEELKNQFQRHIDAMGIEVRNERINCVYAMGDYFAVMAGSVLYEATSVILASGMEFAAPFPGENEFLGRGVGYCATCDAPLYKGRTVTIIGYNEEAVEDANYVSELAGKTYFVPMLDKELHLNPGVEIVKSKPLEIKGTDFVEKLVLKDRELATDAVFVMKDSVPPSQLVPGILMEDGHIQVNRRMETNLKGLYAAGDCTGKPYQYMKAAGEGQIAALQAVSYLNAVK